EIEFSRLFYRDVGRLRPTQNLIDEVGGAPVQVREVWSIGQQASGVDVFAITVNRRQSCAYRQNRKSVPVRRYQRVASDIKCVSLPLERLDGRRDSLGALVFGGGDLEPERAGRRQHLADVQHNGGIIDVGHDRQPPETGDNLAQEFETFASKIGRLVRQTCNVAARPRQTGNQAIGNRVARDREDDRDDRRRLL